MIPQPYQTQAPAGPIADGNVVELTDALGRKLKVKQLDLLYESHLTRILGAEAAGNPTYMMGFVLPAASVFEIDGVRFEPPTSQREIDIAIERLGRAGIAAFMGHLQSEIQRVEQGQA